MQDKISPELFEEVMAHPTMRMAVAIFGQIGPKDDGSIPPPPSITRPPITRLIEAVKRRTKKLRIIGEVLRAPLASKKIRHPMEGRWDSGDERVAFLERMLGQIMIRVNDCESPEAGREGANEVQGSEIKNT